MVRWPACVLIIVLLAASCSPAASPTPPHQPATAPPAHTAAPAASATPSPVAPTEPAPVAAATPNPTITPSLIPPTATALPSLTPWPTLLPTRPPSRTVCATGCDHTTVQEAIDAAAPSGEIILLTDSVHTEGGILVDKDITLRGRGHDQTIIQAADSVREAQTTVFIIPAGATVLIESMTIRHGHPQEIPWAGGAATNSGTLTVRDCVITDNQADHGGGLWSEHSLTVIRCLITRNRAYQYAPPGYECGSGGGIKATKGDLLVVDSTIANNQAEGKGGGAFLACAVNARFENSSFSENRAQRYGGGVAFKGTLTMTHCTISHNSSVEPGGGIYLRGTLAYSNTIIANNSVGGDCVIGGEGGYKGIGTMTANSYNLVEDGSCQPDFTGDPDLLRLGAGGQAWPPIQGLAPASPAIDAIPAEFCPLPRDQIGAPRPVVLHNPDTPCDIGAVEEQPQP